MTNANWQADPCSGGGKDEAECLQFIKTLGILYSRWASVFGYLYPQLRNGTPRGHVYIIGHYKTIHDGLAGGFA